MMVWKKRGRQGLIPAAGLSPRVGLSSQREHRLGTGDPFQPIARSPGHPSHKCSRGHQPLLLLCVSFHAAAALVWKNPPKSLAHGSVERCWMKPVGNRPTNSWGNGRRNKRRERWF